MLILETSPTSTYPDCACLPGCGTAVRVCEREAEAEAVEAKLDQKGWRTLIMIIHVAADRD